MPFTFSHPALVLPLGILPSRYISLTGLVVGTLAPDFEYFLRLRVYSAHSHTFAGLVYFNLPLGLLLALVFHQVVRDKLILHLPPFFRRRLQRFICQDWLAYLRRHPFVVLVSLLVGAASHLLWDSFTHQHGFFVEAFPSLAAPVSLGPYRVPLYKVLQHGSSLAGGLVILGVLIKLPPDRSVSKSLNFQRFWYTAAGVSLVVLLVRLGSGLSLHQYGHWVVTGIAAGMIGLLTAAFFSPGEQKNPGGK